jgi:hypothetical protein
VRDPHATVAKVMDTSPLNVSFRRALGIVIWMRGTIL